MFENWNWKKIGLILGFITIVILLGLLIFWVFFGGQKKPEPLIPPVPTPGPVTELPESPDYIPRPPGTIPGTPPAVITKEIIPPTAEEAKGGPVQIQKVEDGSNTSVHFDTDGKGVVTFDEFSGTFYKINPAGGKTKLSDQSFFGAQEIAWTPQADKAVIQFPDGSNILYDFERKEQITLPSHWQEVDFDPSGNQISFKSIAEDPDNRWFAVASADGSSARVLESLGDKAGLFMPSWSPSGQVAGLFREGIDYNRQKVYFIGLNGENFKAAVVNGRGLETQWSPKGDKLLHSVYSDTSYYKPELWIINALGDEIGSNRRRLNLNTWAHKCAFADNVTIYCAVPTQLIEGAGLVPALGDQEEDHIWRVNLITGERIKVAQPPEKHTVESLLVSSDQTILYFTDKATGNLFSMKLR